MTTTDKKWFAISEGRLRIRAVQGHSTDTVDINYAEKVSPEFLYHGTETRFIESIRNQGCCPDRPSMCICRKTNRSRLLLDSITANLSF
nr:RNA 2'-phosphotransferase [uncultured Comamonas sp.]